MPEFLCETSIVFLVKICLSVALVSLLEGSKNSEVLMRLVNGPLGTSKRDLAEMLLKEEVTSSKICVLIL